MDPCSVYFPLDVGVLEDSSGEGGAEKGYILYFTPELPVFFALAANI